MGTPLAPLAETGAAPPPRRRGPVPRPGMRSACITALGEVRQPGRIVGTAIRLTAQVFLTACLWRALYSSVASSAGLVRTQAVTFAVLAVLSGQLRGVDRFAVRDSMLQHVQEGTILYWFLRPIPPRRYYLYRAVGDQLFGLLWALAGFTVCLAAGVVSAPASPGAALAFGVSFFLGQVIVYHLWLVVDLLCFWTVMNLAAVHILRFTRDLFSGVFAPLWFFPGWFRTLSAWLPFQATLNIPLSFYVGRLPAEAAAREIEVQALWCLLLAMATKALWRVAARRVTVQGG